MFVPQMTHSTNAETLQRIQSALDAARAESRRGRLKPNTKSDTIP